MFNAGHKDQDVLDSRLHRIDRFQGLDGNIGYTKILEVDEDDDVLVSRPLLAPLVPVFFEVFRCFTPLRPLPFACFRFLRLGRDGSKSF